MKVRIEWTKRRPRRSTRGHYLLSGMLRCGICGRRMAERENHYGPYYRCRFPDKLDEGVDPKIVARLTAQVRQKRRDSEPEFGHTIPGGQLSESQGRGLVEALKRIVGALAEADRGDKAELYAEAGVNLTYHPEGRVSIELLPPELEARVGLVSPPPGAE